MHTDSSLPSSPFMVKTHAQAGATALPNSPRKTVKKKRGIFASHALSRFLLSILLERHAVLLLVPLFYFSGMLLFMRNGGDLSPSPPIPPALQDFSIFDISPCSRSPAAPTPTQGYISYACGLEFLRLCDMTNSTDLVFVVHLQANESGDGRVSRL